MSRTPTPPSPPQTRRPPLSDRRQPERTCIGCRTRQPQAALVRIALGPGGRLAVSRTAPGRGAWLCQPAIPCLQLARKRRGFERAFRTSVSTAAIDELGRMLGDATTSMTGNEG